MTRLRFSLPTIGHNLLVGYVSAGQNIELRKDLNPFNDKIIDQLILIRLALMREYNARTGNLRAAYWSRLPQIDQDTAEAESQSYESLYRSVFALEQMRKLELLTESDFDLSGITPELMRKSRAESEMDASVLRSVNEQTHMTYSKSEALTLSAHIYAYQQLLPLNWSETKRWSAELVNKAELFSPMSALTPFGIESLGHFRNNQADLQLDVMAAWVRFVGQITNASADNRLTGAAANHKLLLTNESIPVPSLVTYPVWHHMNVLRLREIKIPRPFKNRESEPIFTPRYIIRFMSPCIAVTKEHRGGFSAQSDDSHTDHSLSAKSKAHDREGNSIRHGICRARTAVIGVGRKGEYSTRLVEHQELSNSDVRLGTISYSPNAGYANRDLLDVIPESVAADICVPLPNPYSNDEVFSRFGADVRLPADVSYRALAKRFGLYLRFDESSAGALALTQWEKALCLAAWEYAESTQQQRSKAQFDSVLSDWRAGEAPTRVKRKGGGGTEFDFSAL